MAAKRIRADGSGRLVAAADEAEAPAGTRSIGTAPKVEEPWAAVVAIGPAARGVGGNDAEDTAGTVAAGDAEPSAARTGWLSVSGGVDTVEAPEVVAATGAVVGTAEAPGVVVTAEVAGAVEGITVVEAVPSTAVFAAGEDVATVEATGPVVAGVVELPRVELAAGVEAVEEPGVVAELVAGTTAPVAAIAELAAASIVAEVVGSPVVAAGDGGRVVGAAVVPAAEAGAVDMGKEVAVVAVVGVVTADEVVGVDAPAAVVEASADEVVGVEAPAAVGDVGADEVVGVEAPVEVPASEVNAVEGPVVGEDVATGAVEGPAELAAAGAVAASGATPEAKADVRSDRGPDASVSIAVALDAADVEVPVVWTLTPVVDAGTLAWSSRPTVVSGFAAAGDEEMAAAGIGIEAA